MHRDIFLQLLALLWNVFFLRKRHRVEKRLQKYFETRLSLKMDFQVHGTSRFTSQSKTILKSCLCVTLKHFRSAVTDHALTAALCAEGFLSGYVKIVLAAKYVYNINNISLGTIGSFDRVRDIPTLCPDIPRSYVPHAREGTEHAHSMQSRTYCRDTPNKINRWIVPSLCFRCVQSSHSIPVWIQTRRRPPPW